MPETQPPVKDLKSLTLSAMSDFVADRQGKPFWASYLFQFVHAKGVTDIHAISPLPKGFRQSLVDEGYFISSLQRHQAEVDPDGTVKFLYGDGEDRRWETVLLSDNDRRTLCISTQVGCRMACRFCATGRLSFTGNLSAGQIVDQVYNATDYGGTIHNVVFMGMGEPLDNIEALIGAIRILNHEKGIHLGQRHMTVSTCGLPAGIDRMSEMNIQVRLAVSLHATDDDLRTQLMPINRRHDVASVLAAVQRYQRKTGRRVTFECVMLQGVNDSVEQARDFLRTVAGVKAHVNLIEFNDYPGSHYTASDPTRLEAFANVLRTGGMETVIRYRRGRSIKAACGQLGAAWLAKSSGT